jgi:3-methyladenine DNA glycosylase Tag
MSDDFRRRGLRFVGSTICYAFMQATGMVKEVKSLSRASVDKFELNR